MLCLLHGKASDDSEDDVERDVKQSSWLDAYWKGKRKYVQNYICTKIWNTNSTENSSDSMGNTTGSSILMQSLRLNDMFQIFGGDLCHYCRFNSEHSLHHWHLNSCS